MEEKDFKVPKRASSEDLLVADKVVLNIHEDAALIEAPPPGASLLLFAAKYPARDGWSPSLFLKVAIDHQRSPTKPSNRERFPWLTTPWRNAEKERSSSTLAVTCWWNVSLHSGCVRLTIQLIHFIPHWYSIGKQKNLAGYIFFSKGLRQKMEVWFPFTRVNAHIQFGHNNMEIVEKNNNKKKKSWEVKEPQVAKLTFWSRKNSIRLMDKMIQVHLSVLVSWLCFFFFCSSADKVLQRFFAAHRETSAGTSRSPQTSQNLQKTHNKLSGGEGGEGHRTSHLTSELEQHLLIQQNLVC